MRPPDSDQGRELVCRGAFEFAGASPRLAPAKIQHPLRTPIVNQGEAGRPR